ncbi:MAG TPA: hypothetical protein VFI72_04600 [Candidatus Angelobacter sp.]|nr:hypothetical protein [Candidatus Angelobacter sp.]
MDFKNMKKDLMDRGVEKGKEELDKLKDRFSHEEAQQQTEAAPQVGRVGAHNSGQMASDTPDQTGTTPVGGLREEDIPERAGISRLSEDARNRQVNPGAVSESNREAELDPEAEIEPEAGEDAA